MIIPTRLLILQRLVALLEGPLSIRGESVDMAGHTFRGRNILGEESPTDTGYCLSVIEAPRPDVAIYAAEEATWRSEQWTLLIQGTCEDDKLKPSDNAYYFYAAVEERLSWVIAENSGSGNPRYPVHYLLGGLIGGMEIAPPVVRPPGDKLAAKAFFYLPIRVHLATQMGEPYTSVT